MAYSDFSLEGAIAAFKLNELRLSLFDQVQPIERSSWLRETLDISLDFALTSSSEKARSEFIVVPILLEMERRNQKRFTIYSGRNLDVDRDRGLVGECDFILSKGKIVKTIQSPIFALVEAKKQDIELGLGQCVAQMVAAQLFNQQKDNPISVIFGCVTTGEIWQFLELKAQDLTLDSIPYYINDLEKVLGILQSILDLYL